MGIEKLPFGIISVVGKPGAGKSYYLTKKAIEAVTIHRRPVYTNLPIRWRVMWHWVAKRYGPGKRVVFAGHVGQCAMQLDM